MIDKANDPRFQWCRFYEAFADGLMAYRDNRKDLSAFVTQLGDDLGLDYIKNYDEHIKSYNKKFEDIDPFTVMGMFNNGTKEAVRQRSIIAAKLGELLRVNESVPDTFDGIPLLHPNRAWFVRYGEDSDPAAYTEALWDFLDKALHFAGNDDLDAGDFCKAYDKVAAQEHIGWKPTIALHWIRPWNFVSLYDKKLSRAYITDRLGIDIGKNGSKSRCSAHDYLKVRDALKQHNSVSSFPELSYEFY